jgi:hypothetical protein
MRLVFGKIVSNLDKRLYQKREYYINITTCLGLGQSHLNSKCISVPLYEFYAAIL